jgi:thiol:disulfide interchange protein DsbD
LSIRQLLLLCLLPLSAAALAQDADGLLPVEDAFRATAVASSRESIAIRFEIADGYYLYRERIKASVEGAGWTAGTLAMEPGEPKTDEFFGDVEVYHDAAAGVLPLIAGSDAADTLTLTVGFQGCHEKDPAICYPPHRQQITVTLPAAAAALSAPMTPAAATLLQSPPGATPAGLGGASALFGGAPANSASDALPLPDDQAFRFEAIGSASDGGILARFSMPPGYYLYRDKTRFRTDDADVVLGVPRWPAGVVEVDAHFGEMTVYYDIVEVPIEVRSGAAANGMRNITLIADFQGCQAGGICYPPMTRRVTLDLPPADRIVRSGASEATVQAPPAALGAVDTEESRLTRLLGGRNMWLIGIAFFIVGLGLAFTPCVYPMVPILSGILAGAGDTLTARRAAVLSLIYVSASALVYALAGVIAGMLGINLTAVLQKPWILTLFAGLFVLLALSMFGFYQLQLPGWLQSRLAAISNQQKPGSVPGVALMGALSALLVGPCVAPPLAAAVTWIGHTGDPLLGGLALFAMGMGMGAPLVVFGATQGRLLPKAGPWMDAVKSVFGVVFLLLAIWMLERVLDPVWIMMLVGILLVGCGVHLGALEKLPEHAGGWHRTWKAAGVVLLALGVIQFIGVASGGRDYLRPLAALRAGDGGTGATTAVAFERLADSAALDAAIGAAMAQGKPVLFDFYADWCVECKRMEHTTFVDADVRREMDQFVLLKVDVTAQNDADVALQRRFGIVGPPATLFFACGSDERRPLRLVGYEPATAFAERLRQARQC